MEEHGLLTYASAIAFQVLTSLIPLALLVLSVMGFLQLDDVWTKDLAPAVQGAGLQGGLRRRGRRRAPHAGPGAGLVADRRRGVHGVAGVGRGAGDHGRAVATSTATATTARSAALRDIGRARHGGDGARAARVRGRALRARDPRARRPRLARRGRGVRRPVGCGARAAVDRGVAAAALRARAPRPAPVDLLRLGAVRDRVGGHVARLRLLRDPGRRLQLDLRLARDGLRAPDLPLHVGVAFLIGAEVDAIVREGKTGSSSGR